MSLHSWAAVIYLFILGVILFFCTNVNYLYHSFSLALINILVALGQILGFWVCEDYVLYSVVFFHYLKICSSHFF